MKAVFNNSNPPLAPPPKKKHFVKSLAFPFLSRERKKWKKTVNVLPPYFSLVCPLMTRDVATSPSQSPPAARDHLFPRRERSVAQARWRQRTDDRAAAARQRLLRAHVSSRLTPERKRKKKIRWLARNSPPPPSLLFSLSLLPQVRAPRPALLALLARHRLRPGHARSGIVPETQETGEGVAGSPRELQLLGARGC